MVQVSRSLCSACEMQIHRDAVTKSKKAMCKWTQPATNDVNIVILVIDPGAGSAEAVLSLNELDAYTGINWWGSPWLYAPEALICCNDTEGVVVKGKYAPLEPGDCIRSTRWAFRLASGAVRMLCCRISALLGSVRVIAIGSTKISIGHKSVLAAEIMHT
jgi:hypothetical protein